MLRFNIIPSPTSAVVLNRYEKSLFPEFATLFETPAPSFPLRHFARDPQEASIALILENRSENPITAWRFKWQMIDASGQSRSSTSSSDSYAVDIFRPVALPGSRHLITSSGSVSQASLNLILAGSGFMTSRCATNSSLSDLVELTFEIQLILFIDGEIAGPDPDHFASELQGRRIAAEFVAKQIHLARAEGRDVTPVLTALAEAPALGTLARQGDPLFRSVRRYASDFLRHMHHKIGNLDMAEAKLRHLESRPTLPNFYRRSAHAE
jgi:hypothetical protein